MSILIYIYIFIVHYTINKIHIMCSESMMFPIHKYRLFPWSSHFQCTSSQKSESDCVVTLQWPITLCKSSLVGWCVNILTVRRGSCRFLFDATGLDQTLHKCHWLWDVVRCPMIQWWSKSHWGTNAGSPNRWHNYRARRGTGDAESDGAALRFGSHHK